MADFEKLDLMTDFNELLQRSEGHGTNRPENPTIFLSVNEYLDRFFRKGSVDPNPELDEVMLYQTRMGDPLPKALPLLFGGAVAKKHTGNEIKYMAVAEPVNDSEAVVLNLIADNGETLKIDFPDTDAGETVTIKYQAGKDAPEISYEFSYEGMGIASGAAAILHFIIDQNDFGVHSKVLRDIREYVLKDQFGAGYKNTPI